MMLVFDFGEGYVRLLRGIFQMKVLLGIICFLFFSSLNVNAFSSASYLDGDSNYPLVYVHSQTLFYLNRKTININKYEPPEYELSMVILPVSGNDFNRLHEFTVRFRYYWDVNNGEKIMYYFDNKTGEWIDVPRYGTEIKSHGKMYRVEAYRYYGEAAFYTVYHVPFYGPKGFDEDFYDGL